MEAVSSRKFLQAWIWAVIIVSLLAIPQTIPRTNELAIILLRSKWIGLVGIFAFTAIAATWLLRSPLLDRIASVLSELGSHPKPFLAPVGILLILVAFFSVWFIRL